VFPLGDQECKKIVSRQKQSNQSIAIRHPSSVLFRPLLCADTSMASRVRCSCSFYNSVSIERGERSNVLSPLSIGVHAICSAWHKDDRAIHFQEMGIRVVYMYKQFDNQSIKRLPFTAVQT
jgi:hypothetical protein